MTPIIVTLLSLSLGHWTAETVAVDVDVIELNHVLRLVTHEEAPWKVRIEVKDEIQYWCFWSWQHDAYRIRDWCLALPEHEVKECNGRPSLQVGGANGRRYVITGRAFRETWTLYDREVEDRKYLSPAKRSHIEGLRQ